MISLLTARLPSVCYRVSYLPAGLERRPYTAESASKPPHDPDDGRAFVRCDLSLVQEITYHNTIRVNAADRCACEPAYGSYRMHLGWRLSTERLVRQNFSTLAKMLSAREVIRRRGSCCTRPSTGDFATSEPPSLVPRWPRRAREPLISCREGHLGTAFGSSKSKRDARRCRGEREGRLGCVTGPLIEQHDYKQAGERRRKYRQRARWYSVHRHSRTNMQTRYVQARLSG